LPRITDVDYSEDFDLEDAYPAKKYSRSRTPFDPNRRAKRPARRAGGTEAFKCGHCRAFIGPTVSGGKHRNHCPLCLWSKHVDGRRPGDRASECRAMMQPIGMAYRPNGEQMIVHRCLGCGADRRNRVAADDNAIVCLHLEPVTVVSATVAMDQEELAS